MKSEITDYTEIHKIEAGEIIERRMPTGLFLLEESDGTFTAIDNDTGDAWTENFPSRDLAIRWLSDEFEVFGICQLGCSDEDTHNSICLGGNSIFPN